MARLFCPFTLMVALLLTEIVSANDGQWEEISSPYVMGQIEDISVGITPLDEKRIFAADSSAEGSLYMSTDNGESWNLVHQTPSGYEHNFIEVEEDDFVYGWTLVPRIGSDYDNPEVGPYRTVNGGQDWESRFNGLEERKLIACMAVDKSSSNFEVAYLGHRGHPINNYEYLFKTTNGGNTWFTSQSGLPPGMNETVSHISISESSPNVVFCAFGTVVYGSTDYGQNWQYIYDFIFNITDLEVDPSDPNVIVVATLHIGDHQNQFSYVYRFDIGISFDEIFSSFRPNIVYRLILWTSTAPI